jgi:peroxidase
MAAAAVPLPAVMVVLVGAAVMLVGAGAGAARVRGGQQQQQLRMGFYDKSCPAAERIVGDYVRQHVRRVPTVAPALLRTHYHDCFVRVRKCMSILYVCDTRRKSGRECHSY